MLPTCGPLSAKMWKSEVSLIWLVGCSSICAWRGRLKIVATFISIFANFSIKCVNITCSHGPFEDPIYIICEENKRIIFEKSDFFRILFLVISLCVFHYRSLSRVGPLILIGKARNSKYSKTKIHIKVRTHSFYYNL